MATTPVPVMDPTPERIAVYAPGGKVTRMAASDGCEGARHVGPCYGIAYTATIPVPAVPPAPDMIAV